METIDYTIGDEIVKITDGLNSKEGEVFTALALAYSPCKCQMLVDIGRKVNNTHAVCGVCGAIYQIEGGLIFYAPNFKKLDTFVNIDELTEVLEKPAFS